MEGHLYMPKYRVYFPMDAVTWIDIVALNEEKAQRVAAILMSAMPHQELDQHIKGCHQLTNPNQTAADWGAHGEDLYVERLQEDEEAA